MMKNRFISIGTLAGMLAVTSVLATPTITITQTAGASSGGGGQFTVTVGSTPIYYTPFSSTVPVAAANSVFQTFCLETTYNVNNGSSYAAVVANNIAQNSGEDLSVGAAWLYANFLAGTLSGYVANSTDAGILQQTIWWTMGEASEPSNHTYVNDLAAAGITSPATAITGSYYSTTIGSTIYDVAALQLGVNNANQDQLIAWSQASGNTPAPVPDGGTTVSLLGMALAGLGFVARRMGRR
jgi:hypothetical protein